MKCIIKETGAVEDLSIFDPKTGLDYTRDFIGNTGALGDGQFTWDDERNGYVCDAETFAWWDTVVRENQALERRIADLAQRHGTDAVYMVVQAAGSVDLEDLASNINAALDEAFAE